MALEDMDYGARTLYVEVAIERIKVNEQKLLLVKI